MIIVCPHCSKSHKVNLNSVRPEILSGQNVKAKCRACGNGFSFPAARLKNVYTPSPPPPHVDPPQKDKKSVRKICVTLSKGGVGKTTTSVNLAAGLALAGNKVLLVDTDTQGQSSYMLGKAKDTGLKEFLTGELPLEECIQEARANLFLLSGGRSLAGFNKIISQKSFGGEWLLSEAMVPVENLYDYIIFDTAPGWDQLIVNVLFYAEQVLIPVELEFMAFQGLSEFMKTLESIRKYHREVSLKYIVPTFLDTRAKGSGTLLSQLEKLYPEHICPPIRYCQFLSEATAGGKTIFEYAPGSTGSADYRELVKEVAGPD